MRTVRRIIASPFVLALLIIGAIWLIGYKMKMFFLYGIEVVSYEKGDRILMQDIYDELKAIRDDEE